MMWNLGLPMRWKISISHYAVIIVPPSAPGITGPATWDALSGTMTWFGDYHLLVGDYSLRIDCFPFPSGDGLQLNFSLGAIFPSTGDSTIRTRWINIFPDLGIPFLSTSLIQLSESHDPPLTSTLTYNMRPCIYAEEP